MQKFSLPKRTYYAYLGRAFAFAYHTRWRRFLGYSLGGWIKFLTIVLWLAVLVMRLGTSALALSFLLVVWVHFSYWRAARLGYHRFVTDDEITAPPDEVAPLPTGERARLYASGTYALVDREATVLLRPADYWRSAQGEHGVMVTQHTQKYLYQFFPAQTIQKVQPGWLVFGKTPLPTLAITFRETWGPNHADDVATYMVGGGVAENGRHQRRTIYFTFNDTAVQNQVWQSLRTA